MKTERFCHLFLLNLALLCPLSVQTAMAQNQTTVVQEASCIAEPQAYIAPETLAMMAYRGYLEKEGISGYQIFTQQFKTGKITGQKIVDAAVKGCLLSNKYGVAVHDNYAQDVQQQVQRLIQEHSNH